MVLAIVALIAGFAVSPTDALANEEPVELIRTYRSADGAVFEICRGTYDPPATDPFNPAYCEGTVERWDQQRWQSYNEQHSMEGASGGEGPGAASPESKVEGSEGTNGTSVAVGTRGQEVSSAQPATPYGGSLDPTAVLGIENPLCGERSDLSAAQVRNCRGSHSPESAYPVGNYGWDIHIEAGGFVSSLLAPVVSLVLLIFSIVWLLLLMALKGCLIVLGFTFSLSPFTDNSMMREISHGLEAFFQNFTSPWLKTLLVVLGIWGLYMGIVRRRAGETFGGILAAVLMMFVAMWLIQDPGATIGRFASVVNKTSLVAVSAPTSGKVDAPTQTYNDAMAKVWNAMTAVPFCAMNFSDVEWCMKGKPSEDALEAAKGGLSMGDAFTKQLLEDLPENEDRARKVLEHRMAVLFGPAPTIRDLYLRFSPQSGPRDALWDYYHGKPDEHVGLPLNVGPQLNIGGGSSGAAPDKVEMQGRSGLLTRMVLVLIFAFGLLGGLLLFLWIAIRLVMAAAASFVLVLAAPLVMFFPVFGQAGRSAFVRWGTSLLGAILSKLIFSGLLGIVLLGSSVLGSGIGGASPSLGLIATMAFWWAVFLSRERFLSLLQIEPVRDEGASIYRTLSGGYVGYRIAKAAKSAVAKPRGSRNKSEHKWEGERDYEQREMADPVLSDQAEQRLNVATSQAQKRDVHFSGLQQDAKRLRSDADVQMLRRGPSELNDEQRHRAEQKASELQSLESEVEQLGQQNTTDRHTLDRIRNNEAAGLPRHSRAEITSARDSIKREARLPADAPQHEWRAEAAAKDPSSPEGRQAIADSLARTRAAADAMPDERLRQVDLHRLRDLPESQRRPGGGLQSPGAASARPEGADSGDPLEEPPRPKRRTRARDWLSR